MNRLFQRAPLRSIKEFVFHYVWGLYLRTDEHHLFLMGGGLAFSLFVCIVPFVLIVFAVLGKVLEASSLENQVRALVDTIIPYREHAEFVKGIILSRARELVLYKGTYGIVGALGLLFTASGLFSSMRTILNMIYKAAPLKLDLWGKLRDFGMVFLVLFLLLASIVFLPVAEALKDSTLSTFTGFGTLQKYVYTILASVIVFAVFFVLYSLVPYGKLGSRVVALSALWATLLWEIAKQVFGYYITHFASIQRIYGAYVLMVVVAFWIYYSSIIFILGAEIGQLYRERRAAAGKV